MLLRIHFFLSTYFMLLFILFLFPSVILGVVKIGGPWTRSMKVVHGPGPQRGSMDQGSMFCAFPFKTLVSQNTDY